MPGSAQGGPPGDNGQVHDHEAAAWAEAEECASRLQALQAWAGRPVQASAACRTDPAEAARCLERDRCSLARELIPLAIETPEGRRIEMRLQARLGAKGAENAIESALKNPESFDPRRSDLEHWIEETGARADARAEAKWLGAFHTWAELPGQDCPILRRAEVDEPADQEARLTRWREATDAIAAERLRLAAQVVPPAIAHLDRSSIERTLHRQWGRDAADAVSAAIEAALKHPERFDPRRGSLPAWIHTLAQGSMQPSRHVHLPDGTSALQNPGRPHDGMARACELRIAVEMAMRTGERRYRKEHPRMARIDLPDPGVEQVHDRIEPCPGTGRNVTLWTYVVKRRLSGTRPSDIAADLVDRGVFRIDSTARVRVAEMWRTFLELVGVLGFEARPADEPLGGRELVLELRGGTSVKARVIYRAEACNFDLLMLLRRLADHFSPVVVLAPDELKEGYERVVELIDEEGEVTGWVAGRLPPGLVRVGLDETAPPGSVLILDLKALGAVYDTEPSS